MNEEDYSRKLVWVIISSMMVGAFFGAIIVQYVFNGCI